APPRNGVSALSCDGFQAPSEMPRYASGVSPRETGPPARAGTDYQTLYRPPLGNAFSTSRASRRIFYGSLRRSRPPRRYSLPQLALARSALAQLRRSAGVAFPPPAS